jgi:hypothetical protein
VNRPYMRPSRLVFLSEIIQHLEEAPAPLQGIALNAETCAGAAPLPPNPSTGGRCPITTLARNGEGAICGSPWEDHVLLAFIRGASAVGAPGGPPVNVRIRSGQGLGPGPHEAGPGRRRMRRRGMISADQAEEDRRVRMLKTAVDLNCRSSRSARTELGGRLRSWSGAAGGELFPDKRRHSN